jgi:hypothetical protein
MFGEWLVLTGILAGIVLLADEWIEQIQAELERRRYWNAQMAHPAERSWWRW